ncbi:hypothetical protein GW17_00058779 [Ensete ventricosum]|uniref:Uncharacterized protein n=1 Tax=Ensete ventricosum TaxID=4639 RepID=A0A444C246_ENSVE|nr:hypothetical protein B296_00037622 [Ensete ventricosum]RWV80007.1 hypothetical protein GW17_00058779 [Ensete ventricosum]
MPIGLLVRPGSVAFVSLSLPSTEKPHASPLASPPSRERKAKIWSALSSLPMEAVAPGGYFAVFRTSCWRRGSRAGIPALRDLSGVRCRKRVLRLRTAATSSDVERVDFSRGSEPVEVIGIGSRKDAVIDFCLNSPSVSASRLRFW